MPQEGVTVVLGMLDDAAVGIHDQPDFVLTARLDVDQDWLASCRPQSNLAEHLRGGLLHRIGARDVDIEQLVANRF